MQQCGAGLGGELRTVAVTFVLVLLSWVLFRARDLPHAMGYYQALFSAAPLQEGAALLGGILYQPYFLLCVALAGLIAWLAPQAWDWTRRLTWVRASTCAGLFLAALLAMETQGYNPFIYFIF